MAKKFISEDIEECQEKLGGMKKSDSGPGWGCGCGGFVVLFIIGFLLAALKDCL